MYDPNDEIMQRLAGRNRQGLFSRVKENVLNPSGDNVYKAAMILAGQKPQDDSNEKLATQIALLNYKSQLPQKSIPGYFRLDENGNAIPIEGSEGRKPVPVGYSDVYQDKARAQTDLARAGVPLRDAQTQATETGNKIMEGYLPGANSATNGQPGGVNNIPPGTTIKAGPMSIPMNPPLTEGEAKSFSAIPGINQQVKTITDLVSRGVLERGGGGVGKFIPQAFGIESATRGLAADLGAPFLTQGDQELQNLQSALNQLKRDTLFTDAGKALTKLERDVVERLLNFSGKTRESILRDIPMAVQKFNEFVNAKKGGLYGYNTQPTNSNVAGGIQPTGGNQVGKYSFE